MPWLVFLTNHLGHNASLYRKPIRGVMPWLVFLTNHLGHNASLYRKPIRGVMPWLVFRNAVVGVSHQPLGGNTIHGAQYFSICFYFWISKATFAADFKNTCSEAS